MGFEPIRYESAPRAIHRRFPFASNLSTETRNSLSTLLSGVVDLLTHANLRFHVKGETKPNGNQMIFFWEISMETLLEKL